MIVVHGDLVVPQSLLGKKASEAWIAIGAESQGGVAEEIVDGETLFSCQWMLRSAGQMQRHVGNLVGDERWIVAAGQVGLAGGYPGIDDPLLQEAQWSLDADAPAASCTPSIGQACNDFTPYPVVGLKPEPLGFEKSAELM